MKKTNRVKNLFKNMAIVVLISIILYIIKNVYFHKRPIIEGFGQDFSDYQKKALSLKIQKFTNDSIKSTFGEYVNIYKDQVAHDNQNSSSNEQKESTASGSMANVENKLIENLGQSSYNKLKTAIEDDKQGSYYKWKNANRQDPNEDDLQKLKAIFKKIDDLYKQMPRPESTVE